MTMAEPKSNASTVTTKDASGDTEETPKKVASSSNGHEQAPAETAEVAQNDKHSTVVSANSPKKRRVSLKKMVPVFVLILAAIILFGIMGGWNRWVGGTGWQKTDDAILRADITPLSTRVSGTVSQVAVTDYQRVKAGDLLVQLKDDDFKAQVAQAEAGVLAAQAALENNAKQKELQNSRISQAQAGLQAANADINQTGAGIESARADVANAQAGMDIAEAKNPDSQAVVDAARARCCSACRKLT